MNTLANYLAIHDHLYETLIYRPFLDNPYYKVLPKDKFEGDGFQEFIQLNFPDPERSFKDGKLGKETKTP